MSTKILESKQFIPTVLRQSRDMQAFCKIFDLLINNIKTNTDYWANLVDFDGCPDHLLPLLASYVGYKYDPSESYDTNRLIIKNYPIMIRNRGSKIGISLAAALSVNALGDIDKIEALSMFNIEKVEKENKIKIYIFFPSNLKKIRDLLEVVRPAGCGMELVSSEVIQTIDGIKIHSYETYTKSRYDKVRYTVTDKDKVGFSEVENQDRIAQLENRRNQGE